MKREKIRIEHIALLLLIMALTILLIKPFLPDYVVEEDIRNYVIEDAAVKYPQAEVIEVVSMDKKYSSKGDYYEVKVRVSWGLQTKCPSRIHLYYNYPEQNFVPQPPEVITERCQLCIAEHCSILFPEEAIIASHKLYPTAEISSYIDSYQAMPEVIFRDGKWYVTWTSRKGDSSICVIVEKNGSSYKSTSSNC
ncbi:MAG: hypothetical protein QW035_03390 [Candidatus Anstonellales archaeon]